MREKKRLKSLKHKIDFWKSKGYNISELERVYHQVGGKKSKKIIIGIVFVAIIIGVVGLYLASGNQHFNGNDNLTSDGNPMATIVTSMGVIKVELFKDKVPKTVDNFIEYANDGYYDGLVFHRVIDDFMIQGGGFKQDGSKKDTNDPIDLEIHEDVRHVDGAIAMARTNDPNSATTQFYICDGEQSFLDDNYAAFGVTIEGIDVVRDIASVDTTTKNAMMNWPVEEVIINSITIQ